MWDLDAVDPQTVWIYGKTTQIPMTHTIVIIARLCPKRRIFELVGIRIHPIFDLNNKSFTFPLVLDQVVEADLHKLVFRQGIVGAREQRVVVEDSNPIEWHSWHVVALGEISLFVDIAGLVYGEAVGLVLVHSLVV